jgi:hypothetical protein
MCPAYSSVWPDFDRLGGQLHQRMVPTRPDKHGKVSLIFNLFLVCGIEPGGAVEGLFGCAGWAAGGQERVFVAVFAVEVDREAPDAGGSGVAQPNELSTVPSASSAST